MRLIASEKEEIIRLVDGSDLGVNRTLQELGINKTTTLDYLNLQSLGIKDYQKILANLEGAKPLTIRDRIAYARRYEWIPSVGHGERKSEMTRIKK